MRLRAKEEEGVVVETVDKVTRERTTHRAHAVLCTLPLGVLQVGSPSPT